MPAKRKKKTTPRGKKTNTSGNCSGASSESESSKTLEILNKISQKFMGTCRQKNGRKNKLASEIGYEADEEASTTGTSDMSTQSPAPAESSLYDFDEPDYEMQISPAPVKSKKSKSKTTRPKTVSTDKKQRPADPAVKKGKKSNKLNKDSSSDVKPVKNKSSVLKKTNINNQENISTNVKSPVINLGKCRGRVSLSSSVSSSPMFSKTPVVTLQRLDVSNVEGYESFQRQLRKRKCETPKDQTTPQVKSKVLKPTPILKTGTLSSKRQQRKRDSGVLMSPPSLHKIPAPASTDTSTPDNVAPRSKQKQPDVSLLNESCFGFDKSASFAADTSLRLSPVKKRAVPLTPLSDYASMDSMQISFDDTFSRKSLDNDVDVPELFSVAHEDQPSLNRSTTKSYKPSSKRRPKKAVSTKSKADDIAEKFNTEFNEIEKFQLSIEEMY